MYEAASSALQAFAPYPVVQVAVAVLIVMIGFWVFRKGERDRKSGGGSDNNGVPQWALYGPVKDMLDNVRMMAEQSRTSNDLLRRMIEHQVDQENEQRRQTMTLEDIRNNQEMRSESTTMHPVQPKPREPREPRSKPNI